jgi:hypothetical protein
MRLRFRDKTRCIVALATLFIVMNPVDARAQGGQQEITFPYVINNENKRGMMPNGYHYEMWKQNPGTVKMTVYNEEARFDVE